MVWSKLYFGLAWFNPGRPAKLGARLKNIFLIYGLIESDLKPLNINPFILGRLIKLKDDGSSSCGKVSITVTLDTGASPSL